MREFPTAQHFEQVADEKTLEQKESEARADATLRRFTQLKLKAWKAGFDITARPIMDAEANKHFEAKELSKKENIPTIKFKDRMNE